MCCLFPCLRLRIIIKSSIGNPSDVKIINQPSNLSKQGSEIECSRGRGEVSSRSGLSARKENVLHWTIYLPPGSENKKKSSADERHLSTTRGPDQVAACANVPVTSLVSSLTLHILLGSWDCACSPTTPSDWNTCLTYVSEHTQRSVPSFAIKVVLLLRIIWDSRGQKKMGLNLSVSDRLAATHFRSLW